MASTYSPLLRYELIGSGEQAGVWGNTTNVNIGSLIEQSVAGVTNISATSLGGTTYTLTALNGAPDEARSMVLNFTGSASSTFTVIVPTSQKLYVVRNNTGQTINFKTADQATPQAVATANSTMIFCDGVDVLPGIAAPSVGTLLVSGGGTGATSFTAGFIKSPGSTTALTSSSTVSLTTEVSGTLPVGSGGTGVASPTAGRLLIGNGTSAMTQLAGTATGNFLTWNGTSWAESSLLATGKGGTGLTTFTAADRAIYSTSASALTAGTLPTAAGGTGLTGYSAGSILYASSLNTLAALPIGQLNQVLTVSGSGLPAWSSATGVTSLTAGTGISVSGTTGAVTVTNSGVTSLTAGSGITVSGSTGGVTISATGSGVSSFSTGTTGLTVNSSTGNVTLAGTLSTANGGTGLSGASPFVGADRAIFSTSASALTAGTLPTAAGGTNLQSFTTDGALYATSTSALTTGTLPIKSGGTGANNLGSAQTNLKIPYGPIFSAYKDSNGTAQNLSSIGTNTYGAVVELNMEEYDSATAFNTTTYRFLPTVAGYYSFSGIGRFYTGGASGNIVTTVEIRKNGLSTAGNVYRGTETAAYLASSGDITLQATVNVLVYLNGSTDFVELYAIMVTNGSTRQLRDEYYTAGLTSRLQGTLIRYT